MKRKKMNMKRMDLLKAGAFFLQYWLRDLEKKNVKQVFQNAHIFHF